MRRRGFEPLQHEQMVLQFVQSHGRITRAEAAQLCRLSPDQVKRVLKRLLDKGLLAKCHLIKVTFGAVNDFRL